MEVLAACAVSKACPVQLSASLPLQHGHTLRSIHIHADIEKSTMFNGSPLELTSDFGGALHVQQARPWADVRKHTVIGRRSVESVLKSAMLMSLQT